MQKDSQSDSDLVIPDWGLGAGGWEIMSPHSNKSLPVIQECSATVTDATGPSLGTNVYYGWGEAYLLGECCRSSRQGRF